jgi:hypothetical protein
MTFMMRSFLGRGRAPRAGAAILAHLPKLPLDREQMFYETSQAEQMF